ncbi:MAG: archease [Desulfobacterales bacterium]|jgi:SHS2 domain-containing protein|nr:archease [Desulfobacterales bacterium]MDD3081197.1 archease [Desulfobacterales bacterium]MDD3950255.1 archease [Desulfobacterales bacterium]MDD4463860.1 archease [Desulfobacterales bacterium]MDY0377626.1 archease [Desulfobacterales bacterium]
MPRKRYELIDHTADLGLRIFGRDLPDLFEAAAFAVFDRITDIGALRGMERQILEISGADWPDLMVNWLRELLYLWNGERRLIKQTRILTLREYHLSAEIGYDPFDPDLHRIEEEIKAVTYHQISVEPAGSGWEARIIFDV